MGEGAELETAAACIVAQRIYGCLRLAAGNALWDMGTIRAAAELE